MRRDASSSKPPFGIENILAASLYAGTALLALVGGMGQAWRVDLRGPVYLLGVAVGAAAWFGALAWFTFRLVPGPRHRGGLGWTLFPLEIQGAVFVLVAIDFASVSFGLRPAAATPAAFPVAVLLFVFGSVLAIPARLHGGAGRILWALELGGAPGAIGLAFWPFLLPVGAIALGIDRTLRRRRRSRIRRRREARAESA